MAKVSNFMMVVLVLGVAGCTSTPREGGSAAPARATPAAVPTEQAASSGPATVTTASAERGTPVDATPSSAGEAEEADRPATSRRQSGMSATELMIWNDPSFQSAFAQSYIAETEIEPSVTVEERRQMMEVMQLISNEQVDEAAELLRNGRSEGGSAVYEFTLANIHFQREQLDQAAELYQVAVEKYPKFRRAWQNLGLIRVRQGAFEQALPALTKVIELGGGNGITYGLLGFSYSSLEIHLPAESAYRMAVLLDPETMDWQMGLARSLFKQERFADAVALTEQLISDDPNRADLWLLQANALIGLNQPLRAAENYEILDRMGSSTVDSLNMLADIYVNQELYDLALTAYVRAVDATEKDDDPERAVRAARVLNARGAMDASRTLIEKVEDYYGASLDDEQNKELLRLRARIAVAEGATGEEVNILKEIVALDPLDGEALILLGQHASREGDLETAVFYYERAAGLEEHEADAKVRHAQLLIGESKYNEALPLLRSAQQIQPRENVQEFLEQVERVAERRR
ncbi:MAG: tetratricopeptide repeat protein [Phycisphaeraceae bacterium]